MDWQQRVRDAFATANVRMPEPEVLEELAEHAASVYQRARADGHSGVQADVIVTGLIARWIEDAATLAHRPRRPPAVAPPPASSSGSRLAGLAHDVIYAFRLLRRQPRFASLVILTMALGIGSTTTLFGVTYGVLLKPLPWRDGDRLVTLKESRGGHAPRFGSFSNAAYLAWREQPSLVEDIGAWTPRTATLTSAGADPERIRAVAVTASLLRIVRAEPIVGSLFTDRDESSPIVLLSEGLWRRRFGGDRAIVGTAIQLDDETRTVIGVLPNDAGYPDRQVSAWLPMTVPPASNNLLSMFEAIALLKPGVSAAQAAAEGTSRGRFAADTGMTTMAIFGGEGPVDVAATPLADALTADVRRPLVVLLAAVGLLMLIGVTNVASLQLARGVARRRELAIRASIGASAARLVRQLVIENLLLGLAGGAAGIALAAFLQRLAPSILPADFPRVTDITLDATVIGFAILIAIFTSVAVGLMLARRTRRLDLVRTLADDGGSPAGGSARSGVARARLFVVGGQIAIASLLLVGALLLGRSFVNLLHADRGYEPRHVLSARLSVPSSRFSPVRRGEVLGDIVDRLGRLPGVRAAAFTTELPLTPGGSTTAFNLPPRDAGGRETFVQASPRIVSPGYFAALDLRIVAGRSLSDTDTATSEAVVVVNETFQRRYLGEGAIGTRLPMALWGQNQQGTAPIVGIVEDVRYISAAATSLAEICFSYRQLTVGVRPTTAALLLRTDSAREPLAAQVRQVVKDADPSLIAESIMTLEDRLLAGSLARPRLYAVLVASFAAMALVVTAIGVFSVLSYAVSERSRELGVRAALGARPADLVRLVVRQGVTVAAAGVLIGLVAAAWLTRFIGTLLYGIAPGDAAVYGIVLVVLPAIVLLACLAPAWRAAKLDPLKALRS